MLTLDVAAELVALEVMSIAEEARDETLIVVPTCAEGEAPLTVTVFVKVVVVILVEVVGTQVVARRSAPRCPALDYVIACRCEC